MLFPASELGGRPTGRMPSARASYEPPTNALPTHQPQGHDQNHSRASCVAEQDADELQTYVCASCQGGRKWSPTARSEDGTDVSSGKQALLERCSGP